MSHIDAELSSHESEGSDNEYQSEKPVSSKTSKTKRSKHSSRSSIASDSDSQYSFESSDFSASEKKKKKKSGIKAKASDPVRKSQRYPQAHLRDEYVSSNVNLFVAIEIEIISDRRTKEKERNGRLDLLKKIMYLSTSYDFGTLKSYYGAVLREIELGKKS